MSSVISSDNCWTSGEGYDSNSESHENVEIQPYQCKPEVEPQENVQHEQEEDIGRLQNTEW